MMDNQISRRLGMHYGSISLYTAILHNIFLLYHVDMFVSVYKIDKVSFWIGETIFLVWNSCNDPLFGWMSDKKYLSPASGSDVTAIVRGRLQALAWNGPLFALSFLAFWFAWTFPSLQFAVCLCLYDGFLTMIDLHHSALLADLSVNVSIRAHLKKYCSVFSAIGSLSVFLSYIFWTHGIDASKGSLVSFQTFCLILAGVAIVGFVISTRTLKLMYHQKAEPDALKKAWPLLVKSYALNY
jgi:Na+/melibiose symporter-like transporter